MKNTYIDFLFEDEDSGEQFLWKLNWKNAAAIKRLEKRLLK